MTTELLAEIKRLRTADPNSIGSILDRLFKSGTRVRIPVVESLAAQEMWRVVRLDSRGETVADFSYPPSPECCALARCNDSKQQVFYGGLSLGTCLNEIKDLQDGERVRVGLWRARQGLMYFDTHLDSPNELEYAIFEKLASLFAHEGDRFYGQTSAVTNWVFDQDFGPLCASAIMYPTTLKTAIGENPANFAIRKDYIDAGNMSLFKWFQFEVLGRKESSYVIREVCSGDSELGLVKLDSKLSWTNTPDGKVFIPPMTKVTFMWDGFAWCPDKELDGNSSIREIEA